MRHDEYRALDVERVFVKYLRRAADPVERPAVSALTFKYQQTHLDGFNGYLATPKNIADMVRVMNASIEQPIPRENVVEATKTMSWANYAKAVLRG